MDGKIYLTKRFKESNDRAYKKCVDEKSYGVTVNNDVQDYKEFDGEYRYGKNIPEMAVIPLSSLVTTKYPTSDQIEFFSNNSLELHRLVENHVFYGSEKFVEFFKYYFFVDDDYRLIKSQSNPVHRISWLKKTIV